MGAQAGLFDHLLHHFRQGEALAGGFEFFDQRDKGADGCARLAGECGHCGVEAGVCGARCVLQGFERTCADAASGEIHYPQKRGVVIRVGHQAHVAERVLDFLPLEKAQAAIHAIGHAGRKQGVLEHPRLGVRAIEQGHLGSRGAFMHQRADFIHDETRFIEIGERGIDANRLARPGIGPQVFTEPVGVVFDDGVGGVEDVAVGAIILLQADHVFDVELALEIAHVADIRAAEGIDALVVIAHRKDTRTAAGE